MAGSLPRTERAHMAALAILLTVGVACTSGDTATTSPTPPPLMIAVNGSYRDVAAGTTLGKLITDASLQPAAGRLLAVDGSTLEHRAYPGRVLLNGRPAPRSRPLATGDRVSIVEGRDHTEPTK